MVSADVKDALNGLRQTETQITKTAAETGKQTGKVEGFLGKWKMGWIAVSVAAVASLYAVAKSSAVISGYFSEFGMIVGDAFDAIGIAMSPIIDPLLGFLWDAEGAFVDAVIPAIETFATKVAEVAIPALTDLKAAFSGLPPEAQMAVAGIGVAAVGLAPIVVPFMAIPAMILGVFRDKLPKIKDVFMGVWSDIKSIYETVVKPIFKVMGTFIGAIWDTIKLIFATAILTIKGVLTGDTALIRAVWEKFGNLLHDVWGTAWTEIKAIVGPALTSISNKITGWIPELIEAGKKIPGAIIEGIGDIGTKIWDAIREGLSYVSTSITDWASGVLGFSPTLREIGAMIPKTIMEAAGMMRITAPPINMGGLIRTSTYTPMTSAPTIGRPAAGKTEYHITVYNTIKGGLSSDRELHELARKLKSHLMRELKDLGRG